MREKTIDEITGGVWYVFGERRDSGGVDIQENQKDLFCAIPPSVAEELIEARARFLSEVYELLKDIPYVSPHILR